MDRYFILLLLLGVFYLSMKSFQFERLKDSCFIPVYCIVLFFSTMVWNRLNLALWFLIVLVSVGIGWFQASKVELKMNERAEEKKDRYLIKKNYPYVLGWFLVILLGIAMDCLTQGPFFSNIIEQFAGEIKAELIPFSLFSSERSWYIWALSGFSSLTYIGFIRVKKQKMKKEFCTERKIKDSDLSTSR